MIDVKKLYHCTTKENMFMILNTGLKAGKDGCIYFADSADNSAKFLLIRGAKAEDLYSIEVDVDLLDASKLDYSYDHNEAFFGCKAYIHVGSIDVYTLENCPIYKFETKKY